MKPYPWSERKTFHREKKVAEFFDQIGNAFKWVAIVLTLGVSVLISLWTQEGFRKKNDAYWKRGLIVIVAGLILLPFVGGPVAWWHHAMDLFYSFGKYRKVTTRDALIGLFIAGLPYGLVSQGISSITSSRLADYNGERYLLRTVPTLMMKMRMRKNVKELESGVKNNAGWLRFGVIVDDPIPWRSVRYGAICERPLKRLGHGLIVGGNGTGKTVLATNLVAQAASSDAAVLYADYKADWDTYRAIRQAAVSANVPFYSFDLGIGSTEESWYDPLEWGDSADEEERASASDRASMLVQSFHFSDSGDSSYYKTIAEQWLVLQFEVMDWVGLRDGESRFDFLLDSSTPEGLRNRLDVLRGGTSEDRQMHDMWVARIGTTKPADLSGLRANLSTVVAAGGKRLRPIPGVAPVSLARIARDGGVIYIGLSASTNEVALKIIGSLVLRDLGALAGTRSRVKDKSILRPMLAFVDEASRMGSRAVVLDNLFTTARAAEIHVWPVTQGVSAWPDTTVSEMGNNCQTQVIFRTQDTKTAQMVTGMMEMIYGLSETRETQHEESLMDGVSTISTGAARQTLMEMPLITAGRVGTVENYHCYVKCTGSWTRATRKKFKLKRVRNEQVRQDVPLVRVIPATHISSPVEHEEPLVEQGTSPSFADRVANFSANSTPGLRQGRQTQSAGATAYTSPPVAPAQWTEAEDEWLPPSESEQGIAEPSRHVDDPAMQWRGGCESGPTPSFNAPSAPREKIPTNAEMGENDILKNAQNDDSGASGSANLAEGNAIETESAASTDTSPGKGSSNAPRKPSKSAERERWM